MSPPTPSNAPPPETLQVALGLRSYPIFIGAGIMQQAALLAPYVAGNQLCIVSNTTVAAHYLEGVRAALSAQLDGRVDAIVVPDGESFKNLETFSDIVNQLVAKRHNRSTTLVALGGGVVGDVTGFVAATDQRGVGFIQMPTTLLAQVDSSVGGKTGVNHREGKNLIGAFHQPRAVLADTEVLATLPRREYLAGIAEVIKYGIIRDQAFFAWLERNIEALVAQDAAALTHAIRVSCATKADVVAADERETGLRAILNFGHTFGHAIEALTHYSAWLHGEAVAMGMVMAADLSQREGLLPLAEAGRIKALIARCGLPVCPPSLPVTDWLRSMGMDKKVTDGRLRFVLIRAIGDALVTDAVEPERLQQTLRAQDALCES